MTQPISNVLDRPFREILILDGRSWFGTCAAEYDPRNDLVLTYDFALKREIEALGGVALYVDHLVDPLVMHANNFKVYEFFDAWHRDAEGRDLFTYRGVPLGFAFRIDFWNELVFYVRTLLSLQIVAGLRCERIRVGSRQPVLVDVMRTLAIRFEPVEPGPEAVEYFFPIHQWMRERIRRRGAKAWVYETAAGAISLAIAAWDRVTGAFGRVPLVFVQVYHPTRPVLARLHGDSKVRAVVGDLTRDTLRCRRIPRWRPRAAFARQARRLLEQFRLARRARLLLTTGLDATNGAFAILDRCAERRTAPLLAAADSILRYLHHHAISLVVLMANIGEGAVMDCVARARGIPRYMIINGILGPEYLDEAKYATVINGYSVTIRDTYFRGMDNVICLGDPRMDRYRPAPRRVPPAHRPLAMTIGASGHDNIELNSYVAIEFDFMHDVLEACRAAGRRGIAVQPSIKVRANGYRAQYEAFAAEYFSDLGVAIVDAGDMPSVLQSTDLYVSIDSQTLFEASCLGIPAVYYRCGNELKFPPFDGGRELVTADSVAGLEEAIAACARGDARFDPFLRRDVMEQYIGPLDGRNLERNLAQIYQMAGVTC